MSRDSIQSLLTEVRACTHCTDLPRGPKPVLNFSAQAPILVVGQAPGTKVHDSGVPWNDPSGERLRAWLGVDRETFYNVQLFSIVPMGFCYPGKGNGGDKPPRPECAKLWLDRILTELRGRKLTLLIGGYAQKHYLRERAGDTLTETVKNWKTYLPDFFVLPHPSPVNNRRWLPANPWFQREVVPELKEQVARVLRSES